MYNKLVRAADDPGFYLKTGLIVFVLSFSLGCGKSAGDYIAKGNSLYASEKYAEAELNYRKAIQKDPKSGEAQYRLGLAELKQRKPADAYQAFLQAVRLTPGHLGAQTELANLALTSYLADPQRPKVLYDILVRSSNDWLKRDPHSVDGLRIKGYLAMEERRPDEAADLFRQALRSDPKQVRIVLGLMDALYRNKQAAEAEKVGLDLLAGDKTAGDVYDALYRLYLVTNRPDDAEKILIRKVKENPRNGQYILQLAAHYARTQKKQEMAASLASFLANPAAGPKVHLEAGDFYAAIGDWPSAYEQYKAGVAANPNDAQRYQDRIARSLISQDKRDEAMKALNAAIAHSPDDKEARSLRAALMLGKADPDKSAKSIEEFQALVNENPDDVFLRYVLSKAQLENGNVAGARTQLQEVVKRRPQFLAAQMALADIALRQQDAAHALAHANSALELAPNNARAQLIRGTALVRMGNLDEAASVLGRLSRQYPRSIDVRLQLAMLDVQKRRYPAAEAAFNKIRESNPDEWRALEGLIETDMAQNRVDKALARLDQELKRTHGSPQVRNAIALTAVRGGRYSVALDALRQLVTARPDSVDAQIELSEVYRLKGDVRDAINTLQKVAFLQPKDPRPAAMLPFLLEMENRKQEAKVQARKALALRPKDAGPMNNLAFLLADTGDNLNEAVTLARQAVNAAPSEPYFADTLGYVYLKREQTDAALEIFNQLVRKYPRNPDFAYHMGMTWYMKGDMARAKAELTRALQARPSKEIQTGINDLLSRIN